MKKGGWSPGCVLFDVKDPCGMWDKPQFLFEVEINLADVLKSRLDV